MAKERRAPGNKLWRELVAENEQLMCQLCGKRHRESISRICNGCAINIATHGDHQSRALPKGRLKRWMPEAVRLVKLNKDHPGVEAYRTWMRDWMRSSTETPGVLPLSRVVSEFKEENIDDILVLLVSIYLCYHFEKPYQIASPRGLWFQMGRLLQHFFSPSRKRSKHAWNLSSNPDRRQAALYLMRGLQPLLTSFAAAIENEEKDRARLAEVMSMPLTRATVIVPPPMEEVSNAGNTK